jgi:hypothetical protein
MKLGPRHIGALRGLSNGPYVGVGPGPTFNGLGPSIPWRLMSGLVDRGLVTVRETGDPTRQFRQWQWRATITDEGRAALSAMERADA